MIGQRSRTGMGALAFAALLAVACASFFVERATPRAAAASPFRDADSNAPVPAYSIFRVELDTPSGEFWQSDLTVGGENSDFGYKRGSFGDLSVPTFAAPRPFESDLDYTITRLLVTSLGGLELRTAPALRDRDTDLTHSYLIRLPTRIAAVDDTTGYTLTLTPDLDRNPDYPADAVELTMRQASVDENTPAILFTSNPATVLEGGSGSYGVRLSSAPTDTVTVSITGHSSTDVTPGGTSATFTTTNWSDVRTVTVTAAEDGDALNDVVTLTHTASGGGYGSVSADQRVMVADDESSAGATSALVVIPSDGMTLLPGHSGKIRVKLASLPTDEVQVRFGGPVSLDEDAFTFSTTNWNEAQTLTAELHTAPARCATENTVDFDTAKAGTGSTHDALTWKSGCLEYLSWAASDGQTASVSLWRGPGATPLEISVPEGTNGDTALVRPDDAETMQLSGDDADLLTLDSPEGDSPILRFDQAPDYELPHDANYDNDYEVVLTATGEHRSYRRDVILTVTDDGDETEQLHLSGVMWVGVDGMNIGYEKGDFGLFAPSEAGLERGSDAPPFMVDGVDYTVDRLVVVEDGEFTFGLEEDLSDSAETALSGAVLEIGGAKATITGLQSGSRDVLALDTDLGPVLDALVEGDLVAVCVRSSSLPACPSQPAKHRSQGIGAIWVASLYSERGQIEGTSDTIGYFRQAYNPETPETFEITGDLVPSSFSLGGLQEFTVLALNFHARDDSIDDVDAYRLDVTSNVGGLMGQTVAPALKGLTLEVAGADLPVDGMVRHQLFVDVGDRVFEYGRVLTEQVALRGGTPPDFGFSDLLPTDVVPETLLPTNVSSTLLNKPVLLCLRTGSDPCLTSAQKSFVAADAVWSASLTAVSSEASISFSGSDSASELGFGYFRLDNGAEIGSLAPTTLRVGEEELTITKLGIREFGGDGSRVGLEFSEELTPTQLGSLRGLVLELAGHEVTVLGAHRNSNKLVALLPMAAAGRSEFLPLVGSRKTRVMSACLRERLGNCGAPYMFQHDALNFDQTSVHIEKIVEAVTEGDPDVKAFRVFSLNNRPAGFGVATEAIVTGFVGPEADEFGLPPPHVTFANPRVYYDIVNDEGVRRTVGGVIGVGATRVQYSQIREGPLVEFEQGHEDTRDVAVTVAEDNWVNANSRTLELRLVPEVFEAAGEDDDGDTIPAKIENIYRVDDDLSTATVTVLDDELAEVWLGLSAREVPEGGAATVTVNLGDPPEEAITILLSVDGVSASDVTVEPSSVSFAGGRAHEEMEIECLMTDPNYPNCPRPPYVKSKTVTVTAASDSIDEDLETLELSFGTLPVPWEAGSPASVSLGIRDLDHPVFVGEMVVGALSDPGTRGYDLEDGDLTPDTAFLGGADYTITQLSFGTGNRNVFNLLGKPAGEVPMVPQVDATALTLEVGAYEIGLTDSFEMTDIPDALTGDSIATTLPVGERVQVCLRYSDRDACPAAPIDVWFGAFNTPEILEGALGGTEPAQWTMMLSAESDVEVRIPLVLSGTSTADLNDLLLVGSTLPSPRFRPRTNDTAGQTLRRFEWSATTDTRDENIETLVVSLGTLPEPLRAGSPSSISLDIRDADHPVFLGEMEVAVTGRTAGNQNEHWGFSPSAGKLTPVTFRFGQVDYTVRSLRFSTAGAGGSLFQVNGTPNPPGGRLSFSDLTLRVGPHDVVLDSVGGMMNVGDLGSAGTLPVGAKATVCLRYKNTNSVNTDASCPTGTIVPNNAPTLQTAFVDQTGESRVALTAYTFSEDAFTDADDDPLTYSAAQSNGSALPAWLNFDKDPGPPVVYTFSGTPSSNGVWTIRVTASDDRAGKGFDDFTITVTGGPTFDASEPVSRSVPENSAAGVNVGAPVSATSKPGVGGLAFSLERGGEATTSTPSFAIDSSSGQITTKAMALYDHEEEPTFTVLVAATDDEGSATLEAPIAITDVNEKPGRPAAPGVTARAGEGLLVTWTAPDLNGGPEIDSYEWRYRKVMTPAVDWTTATFADVSQTLQAPIDDTAPDIRYEAQVRAYNEELWGDWSASGQGTTLIGPALLVTPASLSVPEGGMSLLDVKLQTQPTAAVTVTVTGHASTDVTPDPASVAFSTTDWSSNKRIEVEVAEDDDAVEEEVTLTLTATGAAEYAGKSVGVVVSSMENDMLGLVFDPEEVAVTEGGNAPYSVRLQSEPTSGVTVETTGDAGTDLTLTVHTLTFGTSVWDRPQEVTVTAAEDIDAVDDEVTLLYSASGADYAGVSAELVVTVGDNDKPPEVSLEAVRTPILLYEDAAFTLAKTRTDTADLDVAVTLNQTRQWLGSAALSRTETFTGSASEHTFEVPLGATTELRSGNLTATVGTGTDYEVGTPDSATVAVFGANPLVRVGAKQATYTVGEATATQDVVVRVRTAANAPRPHERIEVPWATAAETATGGGEDFVDGSGTLAFDSADFSLAGGRWSAEKTVTVAIEADDLDEDDERLLVTLTRHADWHAVVKRENANGSLCENNGSGVNCGAVVEITDDDALPEFSVADAVGDEGGSVDFTVSLDADSGRQTRVDYRASRETGDTAESGDFSSTSGTLTFAPGDREKTVSVPTPEESNPAEVDDETFTMTLSDPVSATLGDATATGTILDDEGTPRVQLVLADAAIDESGTDNATTLTATLNKAVPTAFAVTLSASPADTVTLSGTTINFAADALAGTETIDVTALNDSTIEPDPRVTISGTENHADVEPPADAVLTVLNDDLPTLSIEATGAVDEDAGNHEVTVTLTETPDDYPDVTVRYATSNGTATAGPDYASRNGTLTFEGAETTKDVEVPIADDDELDSGETFAFTLSDVARAELGTAEQTITISDDDTAELSIVASGAVGETDMRALLAVSLVPTVPFDVTVDYVTADGTATSGDDYTARTGSVTFDGPYTFRPNGATKNVEVPILDDDVDEADTETFTVTVALSAADDRIETGNLVATVSLADDDRAGVIATPSSLKVDEGGNAAYSVRLRSEPTSAVTVRTTGHAGTDLTLSAATLTFSTSAWAMAQEVTVSAGQDEDYLNDKNTLTLAAEGASEYAGQTATVAVQVADDERAPATARFLSKPRYRDAYGPGETIAVGVTFEETAAVSGGTPRLKLDIGGKTRIAPLVSGAGTPTLRFEYVVAADDLDRNGAAIRDESLDLAGSTVTVGDRPGGHPEPFGSRASHRVNVPVWVTEVAPLSIAEGETASVTVKSANGAVFDEPATAALYVFDADGRVADEADYALTPSYRRQVPARTSEISWDFRALRDADDNTDPEMLRLHFDASPANNGQWARAAEGVELAIVARGEQGAPGRPRNLVAMAHLHEATLTWLPPTDGATPTGYQYRRDYDRLWTDIPGGASAREYVPDDLRWNRTFRVEVRAVRDEIAGPAAGPVFVTIGMEGFLSAPRNLQAYPGYRKVTLLWSEPEEEVAMRYQVETGADGSWVDVGNVRHYTVSGLAGGVGIPLAVRGVDRNGVGGPAASTWAIPLGGSSSSPDMAIEAGPPGVVSATARGTGVELRYDRALDPAARPVPADFLIAVDGTPRRVSSVRVSGRVVFLELAVPVVPGDRVEASYPAPGAHPVRDLSERLAAPHYRVPVHVYEPAPVVDDETAQSGLPDGNARGAGALIDLGDPSPVRPDAALVELAHPDLAGIADRALAAALAEALGASVGGVADLEILRADGRGVAHLYGLQRASRLREIDLSDNALTSLAPLADLVELRRLHLRGNAVADLGPLAGLVDLRRLDLAGNRVSDLAPLAGLVHLETLLLANNAVSDLTPLVHLVALVRLDLSGNPVSELGPLSDLPVLRRLDLADAFVTNLSPLGDVGTLVWLDVSGNPVSDGAPLGRLAKLRWVFADEPAALAWLDEPWRSPRLDIRAGSPGTDFQADTPPADPVAD